MRLSWLVGLGLLVCGCGLADYESKMIDAQKRQEYFEEETRLLGDPKNALISPKGLDKDGKEVPLAADVHLRPPLGIKTEPTRDPRADLYWYPQSTSGVAFIRVGLAFGSPQQKDFATSVLKSLAAPGSVTGKPHSIQPPGRSARTFEQYEFQDNQEFYSVNIWTGPRRQAAIIFVTPVAQKDATRRARDVSLGSFYVDGEKVNHTEPISAVPPAPS